MFEIKIHSIGERSENPGLITSHKIYAVSNSNSGRSAETVEQQEKHHGNHAVDERRHEQPKVDPRFGLRQKNVPREIDESLVHDKKDGREREPGSGMLSVEARANG